MIIGEYFNGEIPQHKGYFGYWVNIRKNNKNYYKIGTSKQVAQRFKAKDYKICDKLKVLYVVEFNNEYEMMNFEELNKCYLREQLQNKQLKGMRWVVNDRFTYNKKIDKVPIAYKINTMRFLQIE